MTIGVYEIIAPDNTRYIGGSRRSVENRLSYHKAVLARGTHYNRAFQAAVDAYGWGAFRVRVTEDPDPIAAEQRKLNYWRARDKAYNIHPNASSAKGTSYTKEQRAVQADKAKARCTPEWRAAVSERVKRQHEEGRFGYNLETVKRRKPWDRSKPHGLKGRKQSPEHIAAAVAAKFKPKKEK